MVEGYNLNEHFDYMKNYIPQPFFINTNDFKSIVVLEDECFYIYTTKNKYELTTASIKRLASGLGMKMSLLSTVAEEIEVFNLSLPILNKLFSYFADCFVFYTAADDPLTIIDVNVNNKKGDEGTIYRLGPRPWEDYTKENLANFTCFASFKKTYDISNDLAIYVKAEDIMSSNTQVSLKLFKVDDEFATLQPMLVFSGKFSDINGFSNIKPVLYDISNDMYISYPLNYRERSERAEQPSFDVMWKKLLHLCKAYNENDFIYDEIIELSNSNETPNDVKSFITTLQLETPININQPISLIIAETKTFISNLKPGKANKFKKQICDLIGRCYLTKHYGCHECGHLMANI